LSIVHKIQELLHEIMKVLEPGVWGILATPFYEHDLSVDVVSIERLVRFYRDVGATGVVALGVLGEASRLSSAERGVVLRAVVGAAGGTPVVSGISALATSPAIEEARQAAVAGVQAVMVQVPTADPGTLETHLTAISGASGLGIVVQDHPASTGVTIAAQVLARAVAATGVAVAIKSEAPPTAPNVADIKEHLPDTPVFGGLGGVWLIDELLAGSAGAMTGFAVPEALVATVGAWRSAGYEAAARSYSPWLPLVVCEAHDKVSLAIRKEILRRRGLIESARVRPPGLPLPSSMGAILDAHLRSAALANMFTEGNVA
jgi:4-hydroxy-tetrahydrodipicolinate synthase